jgi:hypothetical protein
VIAQALSIPQETHAASAEPICHGIPDGAIPGTMLSWGRATEFRIFGELAATGHAWKLADGTRVFDPIHPAIQRHLAREAGVADDAWVAASPERQREALARCRFLELVELSLARSKSMHVGRKELTRRACANIGVAELGYVVALPTFYEWQRKYLQSGRKRSSQLDTRGRRPGPRGTTFDRNAWAYFESLYLTKQRQSVKGCWHQTAAKADQYNWNWPDYKTVVRRVAKEWPAQKADYYRLGRRLWEMKHQPKLINDTRDLPGNHTWVIDHLRHDFWARVGKQRKRLWCSLVTDRASNMIVGWSITTNPSSDSLSLALKRAVTRHGAPLETMLDNGEDMKAESFGNKNRKWVDEEWAGGLFDQMGVKLHWCKPYSPWSKGQVERMAATIHEQFDKLFTSYCGGSTAAKPDGIDRWCEEHIGELPTEAEVNEAFAQFVETFADRPSDAEWVKPLSPRQRFEQTRIAKRTLPEHVLRVLLLKLTSPRCVTSKGVLYNGLHYTDDGGHMFQLQGKEVRLRVDPDDITRVWICDHKGKPLFIARQNLCKGTADDMRVAMNRRKQARRIVRESRLEQVRALDDVPLAVLRSQAERYRAETKALEPVDGPPALTVAPILTPSASAVSESAAAIARQENRDVMQPHPMTWPRDNYGLTPEELQALALPDDDELAARDREELEELCG